MAVFKKTLMAVYKKRSWLLFIKALMIVLENPDRQCFSNGGCTAAVD